MECPICNQNKNAEMSSNGVSGSAGINGEGELSGSKLVNYYCSKCYCEFSVEIRYHTHKPTIKEIRKLKLEKINEI